MCRQINTLQEKERRRLALENLITICCLQKKDLLQKRQAFAKRQHMQTKITLTL